MVVLLIFLYLDYMVFDVFTDIFEENNSAKSGTQGRPTVKNDHSFSNHSKLPFHD